MPFPDYTSPPVSPGCLALLVGILPSNLSTAVFTVVPKENVAQKPNPWMNTRKCDPQPFTSVSCFCFSFTNNSSTGWETVLRDCWRGLTDSGWSLISVTSGTCRISESHAGPMWLYTPMAEAPWLSLAPGRGGAWFPNQHTRRPGPDPAVRWPWGQTPVVPRTSFVTMDELLWMSGNLTSVTYKSGISQFVPDGSGPQACHRCWSKRQSGLREMETHNSGRARQAGGFDEAAQEKWVLRRDLKEHSGCMRSRKLLITYAAAQRKAGSYCQFTDGGSTASLGSSCTKNKCEQSRGSSFFHLIAKKIKKKKNQTHNLRITMGTCSTFSFYVEILSAELDQPFLLRFKGTRPWQAGFSDEPATYIM